MTILGKILKRYKVNRRQIFWLAMLWMFAGILVAVYNHLLIRTPYFDASHSYSFRFNLITNAGGGLLAGVMIAPVMYFFLQEKLKRFSLFTFLILNGLSYSVLISVNFAIFGAIYYSIAMKQWIFSETILQTTLDTIRGPVFGSTLMYWTLVSVFTSFLLQVVDKYGRTVFPDFLMGKYHHPREETRIFMFMDLRSSTTIAEKLGHERYFSFLNEVLRDITPPILANRGEIYQYVGDEVVITWKLAAGTRDNRCVQCFFNISDRMERLSDKYRNLYGEVPVFKAALHSGTVTTGEVGVIKKDIVFVGDVVNTAARIQEKCNELGARLLVSKELSNRMHLEKSYLVSFIGKLDIRGRDKDIEIVAVTPSPASRLSKARKKVMKRQKKLAKAQATS